MNMEAQVENAIEIAWNPRSEQTLKAQAFEFLNQLRDEPQGWQVCLSLAVRDPRSSDIVRHVALDIINHAIQVGQLDSQGRVLLRDNFMGYVRGVYGGKHLTGSQLDSTSIQNKITQTLTYLFVFMYSSEWTSFFRDMLALTTANNSSEKNNIPGILLYLRTLVSVHDEIADVMVSRSTDEQSRHRDLKDEVRQRDVHAIASSWQDILSEWRFRDDPVTDLCLTTIGRWVSWIDISLVVNQSVLNMIFELLSSSSDAVQSGGVNKKRDKAIETFTEIIGKKMIASDKLELIEFLNTKEVVSQLVNSSALTEMRSTSNYDTDLAESVARLVNNTVFDIVKALDGAQDGDNVFVRGISQLHTFVPFVLRFFSDEYDEVCCTVVPCLTDLLTLLRDKMKLNNSLYSESSNMLPPILDAVIAKMRYDETSSWGNEDAQTDEAEFQELRKKLHNLQRAVAAVDENLCLDRFSTLVASTFDRFQAQHGQLDWRDLDLAMHEMFLFGDLAMKDGGLYSKTKPVSPAAERLVGMMFKLVESDVASSPHPAIQLQYMEICVRYSAFFEPNAHLIPRALTKFVEFVHHNHVKVRTRSWYLFLRFSKSLRQHIGNIAEQVVQAVSDLLPIKAELPDNASENDDMSSDENDQSASAKFNSQLYLYEAIGCICSTRAVPVDNQVRYIRSVITPLFSDIEAHLNVAKAGDERASLQIHHLIMALGTLARGFSDCTPAQTSPSQSPPAKVVSEEFTQTAEAILLALESLNSSFEIREAARFSFSRLVGVIGSRILPQLPRWIDGLLSQASTKDEIALFLKLLDQVVYGFKSEIFDILNPLLTPFLQRVFSSISEPVSGTDDEIQLAELKREYLTFLLNIMNNDLASALVSETNQPAFAAVISTIEHLARDITDYPTAKLAFTVLIKMVTVWGGPDVVSPSQQNGAAINTTLQLSLPGFDRFMMTRFSPLCWAIPSNPGFNVKDAQGKQTLGEAANLPKAIFSKTGQSYLTYLRDVELRNMGMGDENINEYLNALATLDVKGFRQFFQALVQQTSR